jgi:hypothetical protein
MKPDALLLQSYIDARYLVHPSEQPAVQLQLGHAHAPLDAMPRTADQCWALLNPGNARSAPWPDAHNAQRMQVLQRLLRHRGLHCSPAESYAEDGSWSERGVLIHAIELRTLDALAIRFGQHATIVGAVSRPAELRLYGRDWRELRAVL